MRVRTCCAAHAGWATCGSQVHDVTFALGDAKAPETKSKDSSAAKNSGQPKDHVERRAKDQRARVHDMFAKPRLGQEVF